MYALDRITDKRYDFKETVRRSYIQASANFLPPKTIAGLGVCYGLSQNDLMGLSQDFLGVAIDAWRESW